MRKLAIALLATTVMGAPVAFAASDNSQQQQPQAQKQQTQQNMNRKTGMSKDQQNAQNQNQNQPQSRNEKKQQAQNQQSQKGSEQQQSAENNQPISPQKLSRSEIKQVQQALDKDGFKAGPTDGRWGPETRGAVKNFQQSKQMQPSGKLDQQTVADLGLDASQFSQSQNQQNQQ